MYFISVLLKVLSQLIMLLSECTLSGFTVATVTMQPIHYGRQTLCLHSVDWLLQTSLSLFNPSPIPQPSNKPFWSGRVQIFIFFVYPKSLNSVCSDIHLKVSSRLQLDFTQLSTMFIISFVGLKIRCSGINAVFCSVEFLFSDVLFCHIMPY